MHNIVQQIQQLLNAIALCLTILLATACAEGDVPPTAQTFIQQYFPDASIVLVEMDEDEDGKECSVWFNDGMKIDFDTNGEWKRVSRKKTGVPAVLIPEVIAQYVKANFPNEAVFKLSKKSYGYKVELSNDVVLKFSPQGQLIEMEE